MTSQLSPHPYTELTPDVVLDALDGVGVRGDGRLLALGSYENRVYQVWRDDAPSVVVKFYRPGRWTDEQIREEHAFVAELAAREIPVVAPLSTGGATLHAFAGFRFAVYPKCGGRAPELEDPGTLEWMGRFLGRIHAVGAQTPFAHRPMIDVESFGHAPRDWLLAHDFIPADLLPAWQSIASQALECHPAFVRSRRRRERRCGCTAIATPAMCCGRSDGPHFVDFDDARSGPAVQDLWMLLSGDRAAMSRQLAAVLDGYEDFATFDPRELHLIEALRTLRLLHYSAWLAQRWDDPAFPAAFPWFNTQRYWQDRILELREQVALMDEPPLSIDS